MPKPREPKKPVVTLSLHPDIYEAIKSFAADTYRSQSSAIRLALVAYLRGHGYLDDKDAYSVRRRPE